MPRSYQEFPSLIKPHFFKIFIPELTGTHLSIPPAFLKHIENEKSCRRASLTGPSGNVWNVDLVRDDDGISMQDGWLTFVADNSITPYDFLLFRYEGNLRFTVMIFDMSACEKEAAFLATASLNFDVPPHYANDGQFPVSDRSDSRPAVPDDPCLPDTSTGGCSVSQHPIPLVKEEAVELPLPSDHYKTKGGIVKEGLAAHKLPNRISKFKSPEVKSGGSRSRSLNIRHIQVTAQVRMVSLVSNRRPATEEEVKKAYEAATMFKSDHPTALVVMKESYVYSGFYLNFPNSFVRDHLPKNFANMKLWNPNKSLWFVKYVYYQERGGLSANWGEFSQSNNLELDDVCVFELIRENEMQVHIFRVVEELTPLSPSVKKNNPSVTERYANFQNRYQRKNGKDSQGVIQKRDDRDGRQSFSTSVPYYKPQQNTVAEKIPSRSATLIKPQFMVTLKRHNLYSISYLRIPSAFEAFDYMRDKNVTVLTDVNGKSWTVSIGRYLMNNRCSIRFVGGWLKFCRDNNLEVGDICKFELISEGDVPEMAVEVYKKQEVTN